MAAVFTLYALFALLAPQRRARCAQLCLLFATLPNPSLADSKSLPSPVSVAPNQDWDGIDGKWNTFSLRVGTPYQPARVLVSTASQQTWVVAKRACYPSEADFVANKNEDSTCYFSRGLTFNSSQSSTWDDNGFYRLWIEQNLGLSGNGLYGWDTVGLGLPGEEGPTLANTTVGTHMTRDFWLGHFGVNPKPTNFTNFTDPSLSYMDLLYRQKHIPSISFGYTAGSRYRMFLMLLYGRIAYLSRWR